jgi:hypothetical protein
MKTKFVTNCGRQGRGELHTPHATVAPGQLSRELHAALAGRIYRDRRKAARAGMAKLVAGEERPYDVQTARFQER